MKKAILIGVAAIAIAPAAAMAQWSDGFESYGDGQQLFNVGGWTGWDDTQSASGTATSQRAHTGEQSIFVGPAGDAVHPFSGYTTGQWTLSAWMYLARDQHTSDTFFIVNNVYNHGGPYEWTVEMQFNMTSGTVLDDFRAETPIAIAYDRWAEIRIDIDLDGDTQSSFYDGQLLSTGVWSVRGGDVAIANIDLFTNGSSVFYDDISLVPAPGTLALLGLGGIGFAGRRRRRA